MSDTSVFLARLLNGGAQALAGYAAGDLLQSHPGADGSRGPAPFRAWQNWLAERLNELAAAVAAGDSRVFARQIRWARSLLVLRGFPSEQFRASLACLREVLRRELPEPVRPLALEYFDLALRCCREEPAGRCDGLSSAAPDERLVAEYLLAVLEGDRQRAGRLVLDAAGESRSVADLIAGVLLPAQAEVGRMWHADEITVADEHFVSETTKTVMAQLMSLAEFRPANGKTMVAAAVAGNQIDIGLQAVAYFFEMEGWRTIQLGANVPTGDIVAALGSFEADLLGLSASQSTQLETVREAIDAVRCSPRGKTVKIIAGGFAFAGSEHLPPQFGADGYAADPAAAVALGGRLVFGMSPQADGRSTNKTR